MNFIRITLPIALSGLLGTTALRGQDTNNESAAFSIVGESFIAVQVHDDSVSAAWYERALGMAEAKHVAAEDGRYSIRILTRPGLTVELIRLQGNQDPPDPHYGLFKAGFYVDDVERAHAWFSSIDADVDARYFADEALNVRTFVLRDPEGNRLQVFERCDSDCAD